MELSQIGRLIIYAGIALVVVGLLVVLLGRLPYIGRLPGDILVRRGNTTIYVPLVTMLIVSLILTVILNLILRR